MAKKIEKKPHEYTKRQLSHAKKVALRQRIYLITGIAVIVAVIALSVSGWLFGEYVPMNKIIASVGNDGIKEKDLIDTAVIYSQLQSGADMSQQLDYVLQAILQNLIIKQEAAKLGYTITDQEISDAAKGQKMSDAYKALLAGSLLTNKLKQNYFNKQVPDSGNQVLINAMMVESPDLVPAIREQVLAGDNFTTLTNEFAVNKASKDAGGVFDWHPQQVLTNDIGTSIPVDWAFSDNVTKGMVSDALTDNASSKQLGYWLIKLDEPLKQTDTGYSANVSAILLSSEAQATDFRAQLEAGADLATMADTYSQYSPSQQAHGNWLVQQSDNISTPFNNFAFDPNTPVGDWSQPIKDTQFWTKGGAWIVQVVDKSNDRPYSTADKNTMIDTAYSDWTNNLWTTASTEIKQNFTDADRNLAVKKVTEKEGKQ